MYFWGPTNPPLSLPPNNILYKNSSSHVCVRQLKNEFQLPRDLTCFIQFLIVLYSHLTPNMMNVFQLSKNYLYSPQKNKSTALIYFGHSSPQVSTVQENSFSPIQLFRFEKLEKLHRLINHRLGHNTTTTTTHPAEWWPDHPCPFMFAKQIASGTSFLTRIASGICSKLLLLFRNFDSDHIYLAAGRRNFSHISRKLAAACQYLQLS